MSQSASFSERLRYRIDNFLARGSGALFLALVIGFITALVIIAGVRFGIHTVVPDSRNTVDRQLWIIFLQLTDPGNMSQDNETPGVFKIAAVMAGFSGVVIFSALIAFLTTALDQAISQLKKGHSRVLESGHTLILGFSPRVIEILNELVIANESESEAVVVLLSDEPKDEIDEYLRTKFVDRKTTRVVTRNGQPASLQSLEHVAAERASSAIVLATCDPADPAEEKLASDARVIKTVLALVAHVGDASELSIVAEIFAARNRAVVEDIAPGRVVVVDADEILAKIMVQTSRTSGLAVVYSELLSFDGCEMYFHRAAWGGVTYAEAQFRFKDGVPIGLRRANGQLLIRPDPAARLEEGDEVLIVAEDDSSIRFEPRPVMLPAELRPPMRQIDRRQERMLVLGWSAKATTILGEYAEYVLEGSHVDVMLHEPSQDVVSEVEGLARDSEKVTINVLRGNAMDRNELEQTRPFDYNTVLVLRQRLGAGDDPERIDSESIMVLLHLRKLATELEGVPETKIITEVLESSNRDLVSKAGVNDFIISNQMVSMVFAQLSQEPRMKEVYDDLFQEDGSEIYVKPAWLYFEKMPVTCRFGDLMRVAQYRGGEACIGYKLKAFEADATRNYGVTLVPPKDATLTLTAWDALVVVAEDDR